MAAPPFSSAAFACMRRAVAWAALAGVVVGYAANTHVRGLVMLVVFGGLLVLGLVRGWLRWPAAAVAAVSSALTYGAGLYANAWLERRMFANGSFAVDGRILDRLTSLRGASGVAVDAAGQVWHLCTSTWGLAGFGLAAAVFALVRREGERATRIVLGTALAITVGIAAATATGIPWETEKRVNNHIYGRYVAILAAFWVLVGVVALLRASNRRAAYLAVAAGGFIAVTIAVVAGYWGDWIRRGTYLSFDAPELSFLMNTWSKLQYFRATGVVLVLIAIFAATLPAGATLTRKLAAYVAARRTGRESVLRRWWSPRPGAPLVAAATLTAVMLVNLAGMVRITHHISQVWVKHNYHEVVPDLVADAGIRPGDSVTQASSVSWMLVLRHQYEIYWEPLATFDPVRGAPPGHPDWVIASTGTGARTDWYGWDFGYHEVLRFKDAYAGTCVIWQRD
jgi:hypothetical protein